MNAGGVDKACKSSDRSLQLSAIGYRPMSDFRFTKLRVYQDAKAFHRIIVFVSKAFPGEFSYLKSQMRRSSLSVVLNIAEGSAKDSDKDFNRYIQNALGSINESAAALEVASDAGLVDEKGTKEILELALQLKDALGAFSKTLKG